MVKINPSNKVFYVLTFTLIISLLAIVVSPVSYQNIPDNGHGANRITIDTDEDGFADKTLQQLLDEGKIVSYYTPKKLTLTIQQHNGTFDANDSSLNDDGFGYPEMNKFIHDTDTGCSTDPNNPDDNPLDYHICTDIELLRFIEENPTSDDIKKDGWVRGSTRWDCNAWADDGTKGLFWENNKVTTKPCGEIHFILCCK